MPLPRATLEPYLTRCFVETGSNRGNGIQTALDVGFPEVRSVELGEALYRGVCERFAGDPRVRLYHGDSAVMLPEMIADLDGPATFWLDGHYACGDTALGPKVVPLMEELEAIAAHPVKEHVILIDDVRNFGPGRPWSDITVEAIQRAVLAINPEYRFEYRDGHVPGDVMACTVQPTAAPAGEPIGARP